MTPTEITIQTTSNDAIIKFEADRFVTQHNSYEFNNIDEASNSPLAQQLFYLPFVKKIYIASNFIAIERYNIVEWADVQDEVAEQIKAYLNSDAPVIKEEIAQPKNAVTVYAESTPNPSVLKFVANKKLVSSMYEFNSIEEAKQRFAQMSPEEILNFTALTMDQFANDDPELVTFIARHTLPRRGIMAGPDEILVTMGAQNALWIAAQLLCADGLKSNVCNFCGNCKFY